MNAPPLTHITAAPEVLSSRSGLDPALAEAAQDFESLLLTRLMSAMKDTVGDWGGEKDSATPQIQGIFWSHLAETLADQGGLGLWQQLAASLQPAADTPPQLDASL